MARKKRDFTEILLVALTILVLLAVLTVVLAIIYPEAAQNIVSDQSQSFESGQGGPAAVLRTIGRRAGQGYNTRIAPASRHVADVLTSLFAGRKQEDKQKGRARLGPVFAADTCQASCHKHETLFDQRAFGNVYIDHRLHDAAEVACRWCHLDIEHKPKPKRVKKKVCLDCHRKMKATTECKDCHAPGSLLDKNIIGAAKTKEFLAGSTAGVKSLVPHNFGTPEPGWLKNEGDVPCRSCHEVPRFCNGCHLVFHNQMPDWVFVHGSRILRHEYETLACWVCHSANWCAGNCHINLGPTRSGPYRRIPRVPLDLD